jgi:hypothetical protein
MSEASASTSACITSRGEHGAAVNRLLSDPFEYASRRADHDLHGDGHTAPRIVDLIQSRAR